MAVVGNIEFAFEDDAFDIDDDVVSIETLSVSLFVVVNVESNSSIRCIVSFCFMFNSSSSFCVVVDLFLMSFFDLFAFFLFEIKI